MRDADDAAKAAVLDDVAALMSETASDRSLSPAERERRLATLRDVARRVEERGARTAARFPGRAAQFSPFAALKGHGELLEAEAFVPERRRELTEEDALALSRAVASLRRGDAVCVTVYEGGRHVEVRGRVTECSPGHRLLSVDGRRVDFGSIVAIEPARAIPPAIFGY